MTLDWLLSNFVDNTYSKWQHGLILCKDSLNLTMIGMRSRRWFVYDKSYINSWLVWILTGGIADRIIDSISNFVLQLVIIGADIDLTNKWFHGMRLIFVRSFIHIKCYLFYMFSWYMWFTFSRKLFLKTTPDLYVLINRTIFERFKHWFCENILLGC